MVDRAEAGRGYQQQRIVLLLHVINELTLETGATRASILGQTTDGSWIYGIDAITVVPPDNNGSLNPMDGTILERLLPVEYQLSQNYPNPFNPETTIQYALPEASHVKIQIYNVMGERIVTLVDSYMDVGYQSMRWDGRDELGRLVGGGLYLCRIQAGSYQDVIRMLLMK